MIAMRLRLPELMKARKLTTAYQLAKASHGRLTATTAYRLLDPDDPPQRIDFVTLDTLCDLFGVGPGELLER